MSNTVLPGRLLNPDCLLRACCTATYCRGLAGNRPTLSKLSLLTVLIPNMPSPLDLPCGVQLSDGSKSDKDMSEACFNPLATGRSAAQRGKCTWEVSPEFETSCFIFLLAHHAEVPAGITRNKACQEYHCCKKDLKLKHEQSTEKNRYQGSTIKTASAGQSDE